MTCANADITLYHYDENADEYLPRVFRGVSVHWRNAVDFSDRSDGFVNGSSCTVRIETSEKIAVSCDDYVLLGAETAELDKGKCLKVSAFSDNRRGRALGHWRIECGG